MARIVYRGKKKSIKLPLPSGEIVIKPNVSFEVKGADYRHMSDLMKRERSLAEGTKNHSFILEDDLELFNLENPEFAEKAEKEDAILTNRAKINEYIAEPKEEEDLRKLHYHTLRKMCKDKKLEAPSGSRKNDLIRILEDNSNEGVSDEPIED